ncbi:MAG: MaoC family dehydratase N-terminal domain-containing protein [Hyphomonadaceae bacterium]|nr:MaoC family dehydratase N-terminal domain-containing protein [Hyphomonadaceae bacterium]MBX3511610.1 MaoC family dehydratase N-terminal domain-containing protein [Hyphomonadaceae bacterium]
MIDRSHIGWRSKPAHVHVEAGQLRLFAKATGEKSPIYVDAAAAKAAGHRAIPAPPTFAFSINLLAQTAPSYLEVLGVPISRVLHGEQSFEYFNPIYAGDVITISTEIVDIYAKKNGALEFIVAANEAVNQNDELCVKLRSVIVVRNG